MDAFQCSGKKNPLQFHYTLPSEYLVPKSTTQKIPSRLAILWIDPEDLGCDIEEIKAFNQHTKENIESSEVFTKKYGIDGFQASIERIYHVLVNDLKVVLWVQLVNLYNKNLAFRKFVIGDKPLYDDTVVSFEKWDALACANDAIRFGLKSSLPIPVPNPEPEEFQPLIESVKMFERLLPAFVRREEVQQINERFEMFENIIDMIRKQFDQPERDDSYARLYNPYSTVEA